MAEEFCFATFSSCGNFGSISCLCQSEVLMTSLLWLHYNDNRLANYRNLKTAWNCWESRPSAVSSINFSFVFFFHYEKGWLYNESQTKKSSELKSRVLLHLAVVDQLQSDSNLGFPFYNQGLMHSKKTNNFPRLSTYAFAHAKVKTRIFKIMTLELTGYIDIILNDFQSSTK